MHSCTIGVYTHCINPTWIQALFNIDMYGHRTLKSLEWTLGVRLYAYL